MSQQKRWLGPYVIGVLLMGLLVTVLAANRADDRPVGMTLLFQSAGRAIVVERFDLDGRRGPVPGAVGGIYSAVLRKTERILIRSRIPQRSRTKSPPQPVTRSLIKVPAALSISTSSGQKAGSNYVGDSSAASRTEALLMCAKEAMKLRRDTHRIRRGQPLLSSTESIWAPTADGKQAAGQIERTIRYRYATALTGWTPPS